MKLSHTHGRAAARRQGVQTSDLPSAARFQEGNYFPDSRVAAGGTSFVSPPTYTGDREGPGLQPLDILSLPRGGESPWIVPVQSDEQGVGRSPGWQWPVNQHSESFNFSQIDIMPFEFDQTYVDGFPDARTGQSWIGRQPPERHGWSWPRYYEQYEGYATNPDSVGVTANPQSQAFTVAVGHIMDDGSQAYGY